MQSKIDYLWITFLPVSVSVQRLRFRSALVTLSLEKPALKTKTYEKLSLIVVETHLIETICNKGQNQNTSEGGQEPHPPGYPRLSWLAGNDGGRHNVGLE